MEALMLASVVPSASDPVPQQQPLSPLPVSIHCGISWNRLWINPLPDLLRLLVRILPPELVSQHDCFGDAGEARTSALPFWWEQGSQKSPCPFPQLWIGDEQLAVLPELLSTPADFLSYCRGDTGARSTALTPGLLSTEIPPPGLLLSFDLDIEFGEAGIARLWILNASAIQRRGPIAEPFSRVLHAVLL
jgi:hypothetical protein